jgi:hypothetical protein
MRPIGHCTGLTLTLLLSTASLSQTQEPVPPSPNLQWDLYSAVQAEYQHEGFRTIITDASDFVLGEANQASFRGSRTTKQTPQVPK